MKSVILTLLFFGSVPTFAEIEISDKIFRDVPYSSQYSEDGSLIRSVDFKAVNALIPILESKYKKLLNGQKLTDRNEAHITVITPPEGKTGFFSGSIGTDQVFPTDKMISTYKPTLQSTKFGIKCVGKQTNSKGNIVFFLVVESTDILNIREDIHQIVLDSERTDIPFHPTKNYYPHITIGYVGGDVHGVSKGEDDCIEDVVIVKHND
jgi:2'-5' RNA ligase